MEESRKIVLKQTAKIAIGEAVCVALMIGVYAMLQKLNLSVVLGGLMGAVLAVGDLSLNTEERTAFRCGEPVILTAKEYDLIELLMRNPRRVYSRESLMNVVWGYSYSGDYRTVDVHIRRLREKLEKNPAEPEYILTKWGVGYYFKG